VTHDKPRRRQKKNGSPPVMAGFDMETLNGRGACYPEKKARREEWFDEFGIMHQTVQFRDLKRYKGRAIIHIHQSGVAAYDPL
jgi:hypothetical protein